LSATDNQGATTFSPSDYDEGVYHSYHIGSSIPNIYDLQYTDNASGDSPYNGQTITVTGIISGTNFGNYASFFLCDSGGGPWSGIQVYNPPATPDTGSLVRVTGVVFEYNGTTEFSPTISVTVLGSATVPSPTPVTTGILPASGEPYEGVLISVGRCWVTNTSNYIANGEFRVSDGSGECTIISTGNYSFALQYEPVVGDTFNFIIGCCTYYSRVGWEIAPRYESDLGLVDRRPPELLNGFAVSEHEVNVQLSEYVDTTGVSSIANYRIINLSILDTLHVESVYLLPSGKTLHFETLESLTDAHSFRLEVSTLRDTLGNILVNGSVIFTGYRPDTLIAQIYNHFDIYNGQTVTLRGIVNYVQDVTTTGGTRLISAYIQDKSGRGLSLSEFNPASTFPGIKRANLIEITGSVSSYQGTIQLAGFEGLPSAGDIVVLSEGMPLPDPIVIKTGDLRLQRSIVQTSSPDNYGAGTWCKTSGTVYRVDENIGGGTNILIDDGTGNLTVRLWDSQKPDTVFLNSRWYRLRDLVGVNCSIAGPSSTYNGDFQMLAGYAEDFTETSLDTLPSVGVELDVPNRPFAPDIGQVLKIYYNTPTTSSVRLRIFNLRGHLVTTLVDKQAGGPNLVEWDGRDELNELLPMGTYILHLEAVANGDSDVKIKPIVVGTKLK
jgi:DNA/RNA endonuclease YhcR with UshA esterase domain